MDENDGYCRYTNVTGKHQGHDAHLEEIHRMAIMHLKPNPDFEDITKAFGRLPAMYNLMEWFENLTGSSSFGSPEYVKFRPYAIKEHILHRLLMNKSSGSNRYGCTDISLINEKFRNLNEHGDGSRNAHISNMFNQNTRFPKKDTTGYGIVHALANDQEIADLPKQMKEVKKNLKNSFKESKKNLNNLFIKCKSLLSYKDDASFNLIYSNYKDILQGVNQDDEDDDIKRWTINLNDSTCKELDDFIKTKHRDILDLLDGKVIGDDSREVYCFCSETPEDDLVQCSKKVNDLNCIYIKLLRIVKRNGFTSNVSSTPQQRKNGIVQSVAWLNTKN